MYFYINIENITIIIVVLFYLFSAFYGVDLGMGWIGFLKMLTVFFFGCCTMQLSETQRGRMLAAILKTGCLMTVCGLASYLVVFSNMQMCLRYFA